MYDHTLFYACVHQATREVGCQPGDCRWPLNLPPGFVWVFTGQHTHFITPESRRQQFLSPSLHPTNSCSRLVEHYTICDPEHKSLVIT